SVGLLPTLLAPNFSQNGGPISTGFVCTVSNPQSGTGTIYYTTNGADPRAIGGGIAAGATAGSTSQSFVTMNGTVTLRSRILNGNTWSAITEATFTAPQ